jgi:hypothetical protein
MKYVSTDGVIPRIAWCAVYDPATGEVVHVHEFVGNDIADENEHVSLMRADVALAYVRQHARKPAKGLQVVHGDPKKLPNVGDRFAYDLKKKKLVTIADRHSVQDVEKSAQSAKAAGKPVRQSTKKRAKKTR